jgi:hypothetical protein
MSAHVRVCRDCGEEYRPEIVSCADCGGELEDRFEGDEGGDDAPAAVTVVDPGPDLSGHRPVFVSPRAADLVELADALREAGISFHFLEQPAQEEVRQASYALLVREQDLEAALRALAPLVAPEVEEGEAHAVASQFEEGRGYVRCPACGAETREGSPECAECGLALAGGPAE